MLNNEDSRSFIRPPRASQPLDWTGCKTWASAHRGKWGLLTPSGKMDERLKRGNMQKSSFLCLYYILRVIRAGRCRERRYAEYIFIQIYFRIHHFVVNYFKIFFASDGKGALSPSTIKSCGRSCCKTVLYSHSWSRDKKKSMNAYNKASHCACFMNREFLFPHLTFLLNSVWHNHIRVRFSQQL